MGGPRESQPRREQSNPFYEMLELAGLDESPEDSLFDLPDILEDEDDSFDAASILDEALVYPEDERWVEPEPEPMDNPFFSQDDIASLLVRDLIGKAADDARQMVANREDEKVQKSLKKKEHDSLKPIKEKVEMARKPRLRTVEHYLCDQCDTVIDKPEQGFVIHGNVYTADPAQCGGLIGNNFPEVKDDESIQLSAVKRTVLCKRCLAKTLGLELALESAFTGALRKSGLVTTDSLSKKYRR